MILRYVVKWKKKWKYDYSYLSPSPCEKFLRAYVTRWYQFYFCSTSILSSAPIIQSPLGGVSCPLLCHGSITYENWQKKSIKITNLNVSTHNLYLPFIAFANQLILVSKKSSRIELKKLFSDLNLWKKYFFSYRPYHIVLPGTFTTSAPLDVPSHIQRPPYVFNNGIDLAPNYTLIKNETEIEAIKKSCSIAKSILDQLRTFVRVRMPFSIRYLLRPI